MDSITATVISQSKKVLVGRAAGCAGIHHGAKLQSKCPNTVIKQCIAHTTETGMRPRSKRNVFVHGNSMSMLVVKSTLSPGRLLVFKMMSQDHHGITQLRISEPVDAFHHGIQYSLSFSFVFGRIIQDVIGSLQQSIRTRTKFDRMWNP